MSQIIPYEWRDTEKKRLKLLCTTCSNRLRNNNKPVMKCLINVVTFFDVKKNKCESYKEIEI